MEPPYVMTTSAYAVRRKNVNLLGFAARVGENWNVLRYGGILITEDEKIKTLYIIVV